MGLFDAMIAPVAQGPNPADDYWYGPVAPMAAAGVRVTPETALNVGAVYACVTLLADMIATPPLIVYERQGDSRSRAVNHPLYGLLHDAPNQEQTSAEWRGFSEMCRLLRGNAYSRKLPGPRGMADQLLPLLPQRVTPRRLPSPSRGIPGPVVYDVQDDGGGTYTLQADQVMHLRGPISADGLTGMSVVGQMRETLGLAIAVESYGARFFSQNSVPRGLISVEGKLEKPGRDRLREAWRETYAGLANAHGVAVLDAGASFQAIGMSAEDSQMLETRSFQIEEIARAFRVPLHMISHNDKSTSWGTGIEQMSLGFILYTMLPRYTGWESVIQRDLMLNPFRFYAEFLIDGFLRGDAKTRAEALDIMRRNGVINADEWRALENRNPLEGGHGGDYWMPANMTVVGAPPMAPAAAPAAATAVLPERGDRTARAMALAERYAQRYVRREVAALSKAAARCASDAAAWQTAVTEFYDGHTSALADGLGIPEGQARLYCERHRDEAIAGGAAVLGSWETIAPPVLADLALGEA